MVSANRRIQILVNELVRHVAAVAREEAARTVRAANVNSAPWKERPARLPGKKRPAEVLARLETRIFEYVTRHPGVRTEQINAALGTTTIEIARLIRKLIAGKKLRSAGTTRATRYFVADTRARLPSTRAPVPPPERSKRGAGRSVAGRARH